MANERQYAYVQFRRGDQAYWDQFDAAGRVLLLGEPGVLVQDGPDVLKIGDGVSTFANLPVYGGDAGLLTYDAETKSYIVRGSGQNVPTLGNPGNIDAPVADLFGRKSTTRDSADARYLRDAVAPDGAVATLVRDGATQTAGAVDARAVQAAADTDSSFGVVSRANVGAQSSSLITQRTIASIPSNGFQATNPIASFVAVPGMTFSFVAPTSGKIVVRISFGYALPAGLSTLEVNLRTTSGQDVPNTVRRVRRVTDAGAGGEQNQYVYTMPLSGLVAGQQYDYVLGARNPETSTSTSVSIVVDGGTTWGPGAVEVLTVPSDPIDPTALYSRFDIAHLSKWSAGRAAVAAGTRDCKILVVGDSTAFGYPMGGLSQSWSHKLTQRLVARGLAAQDGGTTPGLGNGNPRWVPASGFPTGINYGFGSQGWQYDNWNGPLTTYADPFITADSFDVYYVKGSGSTSITLQIDNETAQTTTTTGSTSIGKVSVSSSTASASHTLKISGVGSSAILFIEPWLSTGKRIRVANAGAPSTNTTTWAAGIGIYSAAMIQAYQPDVVICLLGANDAIGGYTAKQVVANLNTIAAATAAAGADFIDLSSVPCQIPAEATLQQQYALRTRYATSYAFMDLNKEAGTWDNWNAQGYMGDLRHPSEAGMERIATLVDAGLALV